jgi:N-acylneuraminate cytidylyltransferase
LKYVGLICARSGSKGLPGKNMRLLDGIPLVGWSINIAKKVKRISKIIISTDDESTAKFAIEMGAIFPFMRPESLSQDDSPEWLVWRHALNYLLKNGDENIDALVIIPPTSPLRDVIDVENCLNEFEKGNADVVITVSDARRSPYFNMIKNNQDGFASLVIPNPKNITRRQDAPEVYDMTTVAYVVKSEFILKNFGIFEGNVRAVLVPPERAIDIDTLLDFKFAEQLILEKKAAKL